MGGKRKSKSVKYVTACLFVLVGLLVIFLSVYYNAHDNKNTLFFEIEMSFLSHVGVGFLVIGTLVMLFDINHWTGYFKERLTEIVTEKNYLHNFTPEQLSNLQTDVLKVYFKNNAIGGSDGFLKYYQKHIQAIIATPYRTDVEGDLIITYKDQTKSEFNVHEEMHWVCRENNGVIQPDIQWIPVENEFTTVKIECVKLKHESLKKEPLFTKTILYADFKPEWKQPGDLGFIMPLNEYETLNELNVTVIVEYTIPVTRFLAWRMAHLSKTVVLTVNYPPELNIFTEIYCMGNDCYEINKKGSGYYKWTSKSWVLPDQGITLQLI